MEKRLIGLHEAGSKSGVKGKLLAVTVSLALLFFIPFVHFGKFSLQTTQRSGCKGRWMHCSVLLMFLGDIS